ncbi:MAG: membrane protein insertase YidC [Deltaproteobacteria bacterium]|nr:membrane protein insertase YidC [Deltaproteobacteria bacterium]
MDDRKQPPVALMMLPLLALGAILAVQYFAPPRAQTEEPVGQAPVQAPELGERGSDEALPTQISPADAKSRADSQKLYQLENDGFVASFTDLNTAMVSLQVKGDRYLNEEGDPFELVTTDKEQYLPLTPSFSGVTIPADARWRLRESSTEKLSFEWAGDGVSVIRTWELAEPPYQLRSSFEVRNDDSRSRSVGLGITSAHYVRRTDEKGGMIGRPSPALSHGICGQGDETFREDREELLSEDETRPMQPHSHGPGVEYVALSSVYFAIIAAPEGGTAERCDMLSTDRGGTKDEPDGSLFEAKLVYAPQEIGPGESATFRTAVYAGPKDYDALQEFGHSASNVIDLGWFSFIARGMSWLLRTIYSFIGNWGVAIILLTLLVRVLLLPFVIPQFRNMAKQRALKPEIDKINELYKDDREKKGAAMMELWRKHKVNPLGGCLPVLLQMPIFFALYQTLSTSIELYHAPFVLWWTDLSSPDPFYVLPIILGALMFIQQKLTPVQMDATQAKVMLYAMPLMMTFFMLLLPTGLCLYMVTSSAIGITQQRYMYWKMDQETSALATSPDDSDDENDQAAEETKAAAPKQAKPRRKKRTRRGRA